MFQGGIKAVVWTDVFQFVVMLTGILTLLIKVRNCVQYLYRRIHCLAVLNPSFVLFFAVGMFSARVSRGMEYS